MVAVLWRHRHAPCRDETWLRAPATSAPCSPTRLRRPWRGSRTCSSKSPGVRRKNSSSRRSRRSRRAASGGRRCCRAWAAGWARERRVGPAREALTAGGKRLRPILLVLSAGMGEPERLGLLTAATAVEVLHTATLIHDDVGDKAGAEDG